MLSCVVKTLFLKKEKKKKEQENKHHSKPFFKKINGCGCSVSDEYICSCFL